MGEERTFIALLRGINVGTNQIKMPALSESLMTAGFQDVKTYVQSGNVLFSLPGKTAPEAASLIAETLLEKNQVTAPSIVLTKDYLEKVRDSNPFVGQAGVDLAHLHVTFLDAAPDAERIKTIDPEKYLPDTFVPGDRAIYLHCPNGYGRTKLHNNFFESKLKMLATTRNWNTVNKLIELAE